jgi:hypothetical protein
MYKALIGSCCSAQMIKKFERQNLKRLAFGMRIISTPSDKRQECFGFKLGRRQRFPRYIADKSF